VRRGVLAAGALLLVKPQTALTYQANSTVELGLIGCGSRGNWIGDLFVEFTGARFVAAADAFAAPLELAAAKYKAGSSAPTSASTATRPSSLPRRTQSSPRPTSTRNRLRPQSPPASTFTSPSPWPPMSRLQDHRRRR